MHEKNSAFLTINGYEASKLASTRLIRSYFGKIFNIRFTRLFKLFLYIPVNKEEYYRAAEIYSVFVLQICIKLNQWLNPL